MLEEEREGVETGSSDRVLDREVFQSWQEMKRGASRE